MHVAGPGGLEGAFIQHDYLLKGMEEARSERNWWRVAAAVMAAALPVVYFMAHEPSRLFGVDSEGRAVRVPELNEAYVSDNKIRSLCGEDISDLGTFGFNDYAKRANEHSRKFTEKGWRSFDAARVKAGIKDSVEGNTQNYVTSPNGVCEVVAQGTENNRHYWLARGTASRQIYASGKVVKKETLPIRIKYVRVGITENPNLVAIEQYEE